jgi:hypothetical protein
MEVKAQFHALAVFTPGEYPPIPIDKNVYYGRRGGLDAMEKRNIF